MSDVVISTVAVAAVVKPKTSGMYFTQETENAIVEYNNTSDYDIKIKYIVIVFIMLFLN